MCGCINQMNSLHWCAECRAGRGKMSPNLATCSKPCPIKMGLFTTWLDSTDHYGLLTQLPNAPPELLRKASLRCVEARKAFDDHAANIAASHPLQRTPRGRVLRIWADALRSRWAEAVRHRFVKDVI